MSVAEMFSEFIANLAIQDGATISLRYGELTAALNRKFRETDSKTANTLQVGSFGRGTGIKGLSDLDMLYIMPKGEWETYKDYGQLKLLQVVKAAILARYPKTEVRVDRMVVTVTYKDFHVEVQPVFEQDDRSYKFPDTKDGGRWRITKPREEMEATAEMDVEKNYNLRPLCKMARAWRNKHGLEMGGLLIDTLAYRFLSGTKDYDSRSYLYYDWLSRDFFEYLSDLPEQTEYGALGSGQRVKVKKSFQRKAKKAHKLCKKAIQGEKEKGVNDKWRKIYGTPFPAGKAGILEMQVTKSADAATAWSNTEEFIEDVYPIDIRYTLKLDCEVTQTGFRPTFLQDMLRQFMPLKANKALHFTIKKHTVPEPFDIKWKVLNRGEEAQRKNQIRGQIVRDKGRRDLKESTSFRGDHIVECYAIKDSVVVAKDRIHVPIEFERDRDL